MAAWPRAAFAQQGYQRFIPLLIDLPGWTGTQPAGTDEDKQGVRVVAARRGYSRDGARLNVSLFVLPDTSNDAVVLLAQSSGRTGHPSIRVSIIDGFQVITRSMPGAV